VLTVALEAELPLDWLAERRIPVHRIRRLRAEGPGILEGGAALILTGVGAEASKEAAGWISTHLDNPIVVNLGTAACTGGEAEIGDWVAPAEADCEAGRTIPLDNRIPFPWPKSVPLRKGGAVRSVLQPEFSLRRKSSGPSRYLDMEAFWQAERFRESGIGFHVFKCVSDFARPGDKWLYSRRLARARDRLREVARFLESPGPPEIAVVIPVYNRESRIAACVESVLGQTLAPVEIVVVDDGSTDQTSSALKRFGDRIRIVTLSENRGVSAARNTGVARTKSPWISFLDSDDLWKKDKLETQWRYIATYPFYEIVQSAEVWYRRGIRVNPSKHHEKPEGWIWRRSLDLCLVSPSAVMMKRDLFQSHGGFDESLPACEDYDLWIRIARNHLIGFDPNPSVIKHGGHGDQLSKAFPAIDRFRVRSLKKALDGEEETGYREEIRAVLEKKLAILAGGARKRSKPEEARYYETLLEERCAKEQPKKDFR
jgi:glycosyltransferase involved in cell wall biosynthesis